VARFVAFKAGDLLLRGRLFLVPVVLMMVILIAVVLIAVA
jgi:hypothetical protein